MGNIIVVQEIHTEWTKKSRGGAEAVQRNAVPEVARIPVQHVTENALEKELILAHHRLLFDEHWGFSHPREEIRLNPTVRPLAIGCVTIDHSPEEVHATFRYDGGCGGAPDRRGARKTLRLARNEWGQIVYNGRFVVGWEGQWRYEKMVVNIGVCERLTPGVFTQHTPNYRFTAMGVLF